MSSWHFGFQLWLLQPPLEEVREEAGWVGFQQMRCWTERDPVSPAALSHRSQEDSGFPPRCLQSSFLGEQLLPS